jgi:hypothetical protein
MISIAPSAIFQFHGIKKFSKRCVSNFALVIELYAHLFQMKTQFCICNPSVTNTINIYETLINHQCHK